MTTQDKIKILHENKSKFLIAKNIKYGDSALYPLEIFPVDDPETIEICVRINDKLGRIKKCREEKRPIQKNDLVDLNGYIDLLLIKKDWLTFDELLD